MSLSKIRTFALVCLVGLPCHSSAGLAVEESCPVTIATAPSIDGPFDPWPHGAWYGSDALAVLIRTDGKWMGMGAEHNYRDKQWWWSEDYDSRTEQNLGLVVTGRRLGNQSSVADISQATAGSRDDWRGPVMLVGVEFPSTGCWEIRGEYRGQVVTFIVDVIDTHAD